MIRATMPTLMLFLLAICASKPSIAADITIEDFTLDNGLRVVVAPNHSAPAISHTLLIGAGAADDALGASGVAHYLEHLMFKGTPTVPEGEYSKRIELLGGQYNAFTGADMTGYYVSIAAQHIEKVMELEADRMQNLAPKQEAYAKERDVVLEERRLRTDNNPSALLREAMNAAFFRHHPYRIPIIGWAHEIALLDEVPARQFLQRYYTPNNAVLLLVGDITPKAAKKLAKQYYGTWHGAPKPSRDWVSEPPRQVSESLTLRHENVTVPRMTRSYLAPSIGTATNDNEFMPLILAESLLGNQRTGVLYRALVEEQKLATNISLHYSAFGIGPSQFRVRITPAKGVTFGQVEAAYQQVIEMFIAEPLDTKALERARNQLKADTIFARDSVQGMGFILAQIVTIGREPEWFNRWSELVDAVSPKQITEAVKMTLNDDVAVTGYLLPLEEKQAEAAQ